MRVSDLISYLQETQKIEGDLPIIGIAEGIAYGVGVKHLDSGRLDGFADADDVRDALLDEGQQVFVIDLDL
jgi:hypothetical protein